MFAIINMGDKYINRGDIASWDFVETDLVHDTNWQTMDISSIVPANAKSVRIITQAVNTALGQYFDFRAKGYTNTYNSQQISPTVINRWFYTQWDIALLSEKKLQYRMSDSIWTVANVGVIGWHI